MAEVPTTEDLVRRAQAGDREAAGEIARRYGERVRACVHGRLAARLRARVDTEDVLQSTLLVAMKDLRGFTWQGEEALVAWLTRVAGHQLLQEARRQRARQRDVARERPLGYAARLPGLETSPTQAAVRGELALEIRTAVAALPDPERRVVELHTFEGRSFESIAKEMGLTDRSAAYRLFDGALKKMARRLDARADGVR